MFLLLFTPFVGFVFSIDEFVHSTEDKGQKESCNDQAWLFTR